MFGKKTQAGQADGLGALAARVAELEARCAQLSDALARRDRTIEGLALDQRVLARRLDAADRQAEKLAAGLLERIEAVRSNGRGGTPIA